MFAQLIILLYLCSVKVGRKRCDFYKKSVGKGVTFIKNSVGKGVTFIKNSVGKGVLCIRERLKHSFRNGRISLSASR